MGHCCLFDLAGVPNYLQALDMLDILTRSERVTMRFWPISPHLHGGESGTSYNSAILYSCLFVLSLSIISTLPSNPPPLPSLHTAPACAAHTSTPPPLPHHRACIYVGGKRIGKVIEKLSCRSGWFVEPVHALIHPAALPHK